MNIPDLHKIQLFVTVARLGSFTRAAEQLHMTQPTVSQQIAVLEQVLGTPLIERSTRSLRLTDAGQALFDYGEKLLALADETVNAVQVAAGIAVETLKLGVGPTLATYLLPDVLARYRDRYPNNRIRLTVGNTTELLDKLTRGDVDLGLVGSPVDHPDVTIEAFMPDRLVAIVAAHDPWAERESIQLDELRERIFFTREAGSALNTRVSRLIGADSLRGDWVIVLGETEAIKRSVELGLGVALIQGIAIKRETAAGTLKAISLTGGDDSYTYLIAQRRRGTLNKAAAAFAALLNKA
ncbi:MAG: LysR family transcriptional regulator [Anaerolinea sp.]|nr:LysR family transcriptional regulator [Anaerolinea sp.]